MILRVDYVRFFLYLFGVGYLGAFSLNFHWRDLGSKPLEIKVEDVYILVASTSTKVMNFDEEELKAQALKLEKLQNAEMAYTQLDDVVGLPIFITYYFCQLKLEMHRRTTSSE